MQSAASLYFLYQKVLWVVMVMVVETKGIILKITSQVVFTEVSIWESNEKKPFPDTNLTYSRGSINNY